MNFAFYGALSYSWTFINPFYLESVEPTEKKSTLSDIFNQYKRIHFFLLPQV